MKTATKVTVMDSEKLYNSWLKKMGERKYEPKTIGELLEHPAGKNPEGLNVIIEGAVIDRSDRFIDRDYFIDLLIDGLGKDSGNAIIAEAVESYNSTENLATASVSRVGDNIAIAGQYDPERMQIRVKQVFNKSTINARKKQGSGA